LAKDSHWHEAVACIEDDRFLDALKCQDGFGTNSTSDCQIHFAILCTPFAEATSCVVGLSTSIGDQRLGRDAIRRWADGRELSKNHGSLEVKYLQDDCFFSFSTDHFPLNHDLWDGKGSERKKSPTAQAQAGKISMRLGHGFQHKNYRW